MGTYYYFYCEECKERGGFLSRQAWGWGNFDIVDSFKFIAKHIRECGSKNIRIIDENAIELEEVCDKESCRDENKFRKQFLKDTNDIFPKSNDWEFMSKASDNNFREEWVKKEIKSL